MNNLTKWAIGLLLLSLIALIWGYNYQDSHKMEGLGAFLGADVTTYRIAGTCKIAGTVAFVVAIGLLVAGLLQVRMKR